MLQKVQEALNDFPRGENRFARWVLEFPKETAELSIQELAKRSKTSEPTIVRFCKRLGFQGFREFKLKLNIELSQQNQQKRLPKEPFLEQAEVLEQELSQLPKTLFHSISNKTFQEFLSKLSGARQILILACPKLREIAQVVLHQFLPLSKQIFLSSTPSQFFGLIRRLSKNDVILALQQESFELLEALQQAKQRKIFIAALGQFNGETPSDLFLGTGDKRHLELSILINATQISNLWPQHCPETLKRQSDFFLKEPTQDSSLKLLQGELW